MSYAEIHFHLLPGVDDGPASIEESVELAAAAAAEGTRTIVATPHVNQTCPTDVGTLADRVEEVAARLRHERIPIRVLAGAELGHEMVGRLSQAELESIAHGPRGRRWLLLEASLAGIDHEFSAAAEDLRDRGFAVVVAHPERALVNFHAGWLVLVRELEAGSAMQLNAWSVAGLYGERVRINAFRLLHAAPRVAIASDAHGPGRMPALAMALDALAGAGEWDPARLLGSVPLALLRDGLTARPEARAA
jgi:protein-tyrosine phosphatase